ncbi:hypothetical protein N7G274_005770 [Stereocaulon virgatum]|uniref:Uncharacterized protein n=1 Tax=Stereocaulon virgatum TaxID=373712 RepID=A0ABR4A8I4_9LECA
MSLGWIDSMGDDNGDKDENVAKDLKQTISKNVQGTARIYERIGYLTEEQRMQIHWDPALRR